MRKWRRRHTERAEQERSDLTCLQLKSGHGDSGLVDTEGVGQPLGSIDEDCKYDQDFSEGSSRMTAYAKGKGHSSGSRDAQKCTLEQLKEFEL